VRLDYFEGLAGVEGREPGVRSQVSGVRNSVTKGEDYHFHHRDTEAPRKAKLITDSRREIHAF
jgi:hypothetical protein